MNSVPLPVAPVRRTVEELETSRLAQVFAHGFGRPDLIALWVGESDLPTPAFIARAATDALAAGHTFYTYKRGLPALRRAIAAYCHRLYGRAVAEERVTVTSSGMTGLMVLVQALVDPGDNVVVVSPVWPNMAAAVTVMGGEPRPVVLDAGPAGFSLDLDRLFEACDARTRAIYVASPGNPTGWLMESEAQRAVLDFCRRRGLWVIADEVYHRIVYDRSVAPSFLELAEADDPVIVANSFSKSWAMTGWRQGWLVHPPDLAAVLDRLLEYNTSGGQAFLQHACITALEEGEGFVAEMVERCRTGRDLVVQGLAALPRVHMAVPEAAFYAFFAVDGMTDSLATALRLVDEANVGLAPGSGFGAGGEGYLRLCFAAGAERLSQALERLAPTLA
jgi:aspartate aminotransferase